MKVTTDACLFGAWVSEEVKATADLYKSVVDIGAGTGLLSLMLTQALPDCAIKAIEIDQEAAEQAVQNIRNSPFSHRIEIVHADIRKLELSAKAALIISNPPFYEDELRSPDPIKNRAHHDEGLLLEELIPLIKSKLQPAGNFFILLPYKRRAEIKRLLSNWELSIEKEILVKPSPAKDFFRIMLKGSHAGAMTHTTVLKTMEITDANGSYMPQFTSLLKDYYLFL